MTEERFKAINEKKLQIEDRIAFLLSRTRPKPNFNSIPKADPNLPLQSSVMPLDLTAVVSKRDVTDGTAQTLTYRSPRAKPPGVDNLTQDDLYQPELLALTSQLEAEKAALSGLQKELQDAQVRSAEESEKRLKDLSDEMAQKMQQLVGQVSELEARHLADTSTIDQLDDQVRFPISYYSVALFD